MLWSLSCLPLDRMADRELWLAATVRQCQREYQTEFR